MCDMPNKNSLGAVKKRAAKQSRINRTSLSEGLISVAAK